MALLLVISPLIPAAGTVEAATVTPGATYYQPVDTWIPAADAAADATDGADFGVGKKIGNEGAVFPSGSNTPADVLYPIEYKIPSLAQAPQKSAYLLVRAYDVDEHEIDALGKTVANTGEWDRVYMSNDPSHIVLGTYPGGTNWSTTKVSGKSAEYKKEFNSDYYVGALSGNNDTWNTTVMKLDANAISRLGTVSNGKENYFGISTHHHKSATTNASNWVVEVDWAQLVIDGGVRQTGEITNAIITLADGQVTVDPTFIPKMDGNFSMEINVIETKNGEDLNLATERLEFPNSIAGQPRSPDGLPGGMAIPVLSDPSIKANKEYTINIILFNNKDNTTFNPSEVQHIYSLSTFDPKVADIAKSGLQYEEIKFTQNDFESKFSRISGATDNTLNKVMIVTLPNASAGKLLKGPNVTDVVYAGDEILAADLDKLRFVPDPNGGFNQPVTFRWNGYDAGKATYAQFDANVTLTPNLAPVVSAVNKTGNEGDLSVPFTAGDFTGSSYQDTTALGKVKIVTLPTAGTLQLNNVNVTAGQEIPAGSLGQLKFIPDPGQTGTVTFTWNGWDGAQYALNPAPVAIKINTAPVVNNLAKPGLEGQPVIIPKSELTYTDADGDTLSQIKITLPNGFSTLGTLKSVTGAVYTPISSGDVINFQTLDRLVFTPAQGMPVLTPVVFQWSGTDGKQYANTPATITITYDGKPVAQPKIVEAEEGATSIPIELLGTDAEPSILEYAITNGPGRGSLVPDGSNTGNHWIYTPTAPFKWGKDTFSFTVTDDVYRQVSNPAAVTVQINRALDGWVGNKAQGDPSLVYGLPSQPLKLSAVSSLKATQVIATINGVEVPLTWTNSATSATDEYKQWSVNYPLPANMAPGDYTVTFIAKNGNTLLPTEPTTRLIDNPFRVMATGLKLTADPEKILGDGNSTTKLTGLLTDGEGNPISGVKVVFSAPTDKGSFEGPDWAITDNEGKAVVTFKSAKITGVSEQFVPVSATVNDSVRGLYGQDQITITFMPATVAGIITSGASNTPVANATVRVTLDLNGNGIIEPGIDFDETTTTDANGAYSVIVPRGNVVYDMDVTQNIMVGGVSTPVTYKQKASVGEVTGGGSEQFDSEKTVTGVVLMKKPDGQTSMISSDLSSSLKVYLKDSAGNYIMDGASPKAFELKNGVFSANGLTVGEYTLEIRYDFGDGQQLTISKSKVKVNADGEMNITQELVDPYGTIRDDVTGQVIQGATVELKYADSTRNRNKGRTPNTGVVLPALVGFEPNNNASPTQSSDKNGFYAYMVYPEADYYLVVTKPGYQTYTSPTLSVEFDIVKHDLRLKPQPSGGGGGGFYVAPQPSVTLNLSVDKGLVEEGASTVVTVDYKNTSLTTLTTGDIRVTLPEGAVVVDANGGHVDGRTVTWTVKDLVGGNTGSFKLVVKWPQLTSPDASYDLPGEFLLGGTGSQSVKAQSAVKVKVFSKRFENLQHQRYILGYPDGLFKPDRSLTRAELAAIVARLTENVNLQDSLHYSDVSADHWAANYIRIVTKHGYFSGFEDGTFRPDVAVTRAELASVMIRFLKMESSEPGSLHFNDIEGHWAASAIEQLFRGKFVSGYPDGSFKPQNDIIRSEAVTLINRMLYRGPLQGLTPLFPDIQSSHWAFGDVQEATQSHESIRNTDGSEAWKRTIGDKVQ